MSNPIQRVVGRVFIPVRDMPVAIEWYAALLGFEPGRATHGGTIYDIPSEGETRIALDANRVDIGSVTFVQFEDPDANPLMACQRS